MAYLVGKKLYQVDIKVYQYWEAHLCPFWLHPDMLEGKWIAPGVYSVEMFETDEAYERFCAWCFDNERIMKVIGFTKLEDSKTHGNDSEQQKTVVGPQGPIGAGGVPS